MSHWVEEGIAYLHDGKREEGERALRIAVKEDDRDVTAWLWLSQAITSDAEKITCLLKVLELDPHNVVARQKLAAMQDKGRLKGEEHVSPFKTDDPIEAGPRADAFKFDEAPVEEKIETEVIASTPRSENPFSLPQDSTEGKPKFNQTDVKLARAMKIVMSVLIILGVALIIGFLVILLR